jgi:hypothetical protein
MSAAVFDLSDFSAPNYLRHRRWRVLAGGICVALLGVWITVLWYVAEFGASHPLMAGTAAILIAASIFVAGLSLTFPLYPVRFWSPPPISISITSRTIDFGLPSGEVRSVDFANPELKMTVFARPDGKHVPQYARYRLEVRRTRGDRGVPWRKIIPIAYLSKDAEEALLVAARTHFLRVEERKDYREFSLASPELGLFIKIGPAERSAPIVR